MIEHAISTAEVQVPTSSQPVPRVKVSIHAVREARSNARVMQIAGALTEAGFDVSLVDIETHASLPVEEHVQGFKLQHIILPDWLTSRRFEPLFIFKALQAFVLSTLRLIHDDADIYHANDVTAMPATFIAALVRRKPLIFELIDLQFPVPETGLSFWRRLGWFVSLMHKVILPRCAAVIVTSPLHGEEMQRRFHMPPYTVIRNIPPYRAVQKTEHLRQYLGLNARSRIVLYQGYIQGSRGLDVLVRAASLFEKDIVFIMMGGSVGTTQEMLEALMREYNVEDRVKIIPPVPYEELFEWTASADIGVVLSAQDSFNLKRSLPNKLFEYIMAGLPVVSAPMEAVEEVITHYDIGYVVPSFSPTDVAEAINSLLSNTAEYERMREHTVQAVQELCWEQESQRLVQLYKDIMTRYK
jgi:glycosyltransferase involved in cell wall biosynthesis